MSDIIQKYTQTWITQIWFSHQKVFEMQSYYYVSWLAQVALKKVTLTSNVSNLLKQSPLVLGKYN